MRCQARMRKKTRNSLSNPKPGEALGPTIRTSLMEWMSEKQFQFWSKL